MHITTKHKKQAEKGKKKEDENDDDHDDKKARFASVMDEPDVSDYEFDPLDMETSSQIGGWDHLDKTSDICAEFLKHKPEQNTEFVDLDDTVDQIVSARTGTKDNNNRKEKDLIDLEVTISADQDHNYLFDDDNENVDPSELIASLRTKLVTMTENMKEKEEEVDRLMDENRRVKEESRVKDETNDALTASNNSLEDVKNLLESKVKVLEETKSKYELRLKTYGATIRQMDLELKDAKKTDAKPEASEKLLDEKVKKISKQLNEKQKELKLEKAIVKKKESSEKEMQLSINEKNRKISELETANTRLELMYEHAKELGQKTPKSNDEKGKPTKVSDAKEPSESEAKKQNAKCFYENNGTCREAEKCKFVHPKKTCQSFSKLGSCAQESLCEHRHPRKVCPRLQSTGYCAGGDRCRDRHPLEYAYPQSRYRKQYLNNNFNTCFLGSSPHSLQGPGVSDQTFQAGPREPWTPPFQAGVSQGPPPQHPHPGHQAGHRHPHPNQGWGGQMW